MVYENSFLCGREPSDVLHDIRNDNVDALKVYDNLESLLAPYGVALLYEAISHRALKVTNYLLGDKKLSIDLVQRFSQEFFLTSDKRGLEDVALLLIQYGHPIDMIFWDLILSKNWTRVVEYVMKNRSEWHAELLENYLLESYTIVTDAVWLFLRNKNISELIKQNPSEFDILIFTLCQNVDELRYLYQCGADPKRLVKEGKGTRPIPDEITWSKEMWEFAFERGLTVEDLKNIRSVIDQVLYDCIKDPSILPNQASKQ